MNVIKQLSVNMAAKIRYDIPESGSFLVIWEFMGEAFSGTYRYRDGGQLQVYVDGHGYCDAGCGVADDYYGLDDLLAIARNEPQGFDQVKMIAVVVIEVE